MTLSTILIVILILLLIGALPTWGYSRGWGYAPAGGLGLVLLILLILALMGRIQGAAMKGILAWLIGIPIPIIIILYLLDVF